MERDYWLRRKRVSFMLAGEATSAEAKLIHYDLAGRYSVKAARSALEGPSDYAGRSAPVADAGSLAADNCAKADEDYYRKLALGAEYLASEAAGSMEIAEHERMALVYLQRAREAAWGERLIP